MAEKWPESAAVLQGTEFDVGQVQLLGRTEQAEGAIGFCDYGARRYKGFGVFGDSISQRSGGQVKAYRLVDPIWFDRASLMFSLGSSHRYYLYEGHCDMRKNMDGLSGLVSNELGRNPTSGEVFVFLNRRRTHMKLLHWEPGGFVLYYKRLESGTFPLPKNAPMLQLSWSDLVLMVQGIRIVKSHQNKRYQLAI